MPRSPSCSGVAAGPRPSIAAAGTADILLLSCCDEALAKFASASPEGHGPSLCPTDLATVARRSASRPDHRIASARAILIVLPDSFVSWRDAIEAIAVVAHARKIAFAVVTANDLDEAPIRLLTNLPSSTLRRLNALYRQRSARAATAMLTQFALAAGLAATLEIAAAPVPATDAFGGAPDESPQRDPVEDAA